MIRSFKRYYRHVRLFEIWLDNSTYGVSFMVTCGFSCKLSKCYNSSLTCDKCPYVIRLKNSYL